MTGKTVGSIRSTSNEVPVGNAGRILFTCDWHCSMAATMSSPQSKLTEISAVPRLVVDLTLRSEEHTSELQSQSTLVCRLLLDKTKAATRARDAQFLLPDASPHGVAVAVVSSTGRCVTC